MAENSGDGSSESGRCILDRLAGIELGQPDQSRFQYEVDTVRNLAAGLAYLAQAVSGMEVELRKRGCFGRKNQELWHGQDEELADVPYRLVVCTFHWYAVSACNMARLIGWIARKVDNTRPTPDKYVQMVMPRIRMFRDKFAAHLAGAMESSFDSPAERTLSILPPIDYQAGYFIATPNVLIRAESVPGETSTSDSVKPWALTCAHLQLGKRYWGVPEEYAGKEFGPT